MVARRIYRRRKSQRRGTILILSALLLIGLLFCLAFAIDVGYMAMVRTEAQRCADAAALASAWEMVGESRLRGDYFRTYYGARSKAREFAARNRVGVNENPVLQWNIGNSDAEGDIVLGRLEDPSDKTERLSLKNPTTFNAVNVRLHCTADRNQQSPFFFGRLSGLASFDTVATATAVFSDNVRGFRPTENLNASLLPFTLKRADWITQIIDGAGGDNWSYDGQGNLAPGSDGIPEIVLFPVDVREGNDEVGSGNFGTINIGTSNNATETLVRQIREGLSADDLAAYDGTFALDSSGSLMLNGDPGLSIGLKSAIDDVVGGPRTIPIYDALQGGGGNTPN